MHTLLALLALSCTPAPSTPAPLEPTRSARSEPSGLGTLTDAARRSDGRLPLTPGALKVLPEPLSAGLSPESQSKLLTAMNQSYGACSECVLEGVAAGDCLQTCPVQEKVARLAGELLEMGVPDQAVLASLSFAQGWVPLGPLKGPQLPGLTPSGPTLYVVVDYESPFAREAWELAMETQARHPDLSIQPLFWSPERHELSELALRAVLAAEQQGKFLAMHELLIPPDAALERMALLAAAESIGLDMARFRSDLVDNPQGELISTHQQAGQSAGVHGDPCFFLNGWRMRGLPASEVLDRLYRLEEHP